MTKLGSQNLQILEYGIVFHCQRIAKCDVFLVPVKFDSNPVHITYVVTKDADPFFSEPPQFSICTKVSF